MYAAKAIYSCICGMRFTTTSRLAKHIEAGKKRGESDHGEKVDEQDRK